MGKYVENGVGRRSVMSWETLRRFGAGSTPDSIAMVRREREKVDVKAI